MEHEFLSQVLGALPSSNYPNPMRNYVSQAPNATKLKKRKPTNNRKKNKRLKLCPHEGSERQDLRLKTLKFPVQKKKLSQRETEEQLQLRLKIRHPVSKKQSLENKTKI